MNHLRKKLSAKAPISEESEINNDDIGEGLDEAQLAALVNDFRGSVLYPIIALAAATGTRRNELLGLRWADVDLEKRTLRIEWALEQTKRYGIRRKRPTTERGLRTIDLDHATFAMLVAERERHQRIHAGIPNGAVVDLSLVRLPKGALIFPATPKTGEFDLTVPRNPRNFSKEFARRAEVLGFGSTRFHDLRGCHTTALLDAGVPIHRVASASATTRRSCCATTPNVGGQRRLTTTSRTQSERSRPVFSVTLDDIAPRLPQAPLCSYPPLLFHPLTD